MLEAFSVTGRWDVHALAVLGDGAPCDLDALGLQHKSQLAVAEGFVVGLCGYHSL